MSWNDAWISGKLYSKNSVVRYNDEVYRQKVEVTSVVRTLSDICGSYNVRDYCCVGDYLYAMYTFEVNDRDGRVLYVDKIRISDMVTVETCQIHNDYYINKYGATDLYESFMMCSLNEGILFNLKTSWGSRNHYHFDWRSIYALSTTMHETTTSYGPHMWFCRTIDDIGKGQFVTPSTSKIYNYDFSLHGTIPSSLGYGLNDHPSESSTFYPVCTCADDDYFYSYYVDSKCKNDYDYPEPQTCNDTAYMCRLLKISRSDYSKVTQTEIACLNRWYYLEGAIACNDNYVYAIQPSTANLLTYDKDLNLLGSVKIGGDGGTDRRFIASGNNIFDIVRYGTSGTQSQSLPPSTVPPPYDPSRWQKVTGGNFSVSY